MSPCLHRDLDPGGSSELHRPCARDIDDDGSAEAPAVRLDADDDLTVDGDRRHATTVDEASASGPRGIEEPGRRTRGIGIPRGRFVRRGSDVVGERTGDQASDLRGLDDPRVDADRLLHLDVSAHVVGQCRGHDVHEPGPHEPAIAGADQVMPRLEVREGGPGQARIGFEVVVHPHEPGRTAGRAGGDGEALEDDDPRAAPGQVEGETRALDPGTHDDDVSGLGHASIMRRGQAARGP